MSETQVFHSPVQPMNLKDLLLEYERQIIVNALHKAGGNQRRAAEALGVLPTTFSEKLKRLGLRRGMRPEGEVAGHDPGASREP